MAQPMRSQRSRQQAGYERTTAPPPIEHSRRSWCRDGVHHSVETTSYSSPGFSFAFASTSVCAPVNFHSRRSTGSGLIGTAFDLFDGMLSMQQQHLSDPNSDRRASRRIDEDNDGFVYPPIRTSMRRNSTLPQTLFATFVNGLAQRSEQNHRTLRNSGSASRPQTSHRPRSHRECVGGNERFASIQSENNDAHSYPYHGQSDPDGETDADHHRAEARRNRKRFEQASREANVDAFYLRSLLNAAQRHEALYEAAQRNSNHSKAETEAREHQSNTGRSSHWNRASVAAEDPFLSFRFGSFGGSPMFTSTPFSEFQELRDDHFFRDPVDDTFRTSARSYSFPFAEDSDRMFAETGGNPSPQTSRRFNSSHAPPGSQSGEQARAFPGFQTSQPRPPRNILQPAEAKSLYAAYNHRWETLSATDANVPYPARGLMANNLVVRDTIWSPLITSPASTWSDEMIMQANAQAFFLGAVDLQPVYSQAPGTGKVQMGFDRTKATADQLATLLAMLKKERMRWHSDRLGRRNGGLSEPNVALQRSEKARAVFHAVCELLALIQ